MASTELPWLIFGRKVRPYALAVMLASLFVAGSILIQREDAGSALDNWTAAGLLVGSLGIIAAGTLIAGWWLRSEKAMQWGLLLSAGVFGARAGFIFTSTHNWLAISAWLSTCWVVASAGAYLAESSTSRPQ